MSPSVGTGRDLLAAAGVLFPDREGRILVVWVSYQAKHPVEIPGGGWEPPDGSPRETALREIAEELGFTPRLAGLACLDWTPDRFRPPVAAFLYWAEPLTEEQLAGIHLEADELRGYRFVTPREAGSALPPKLSRRVTACLRAPRGAAPLELEDGFAVGHTTEVLAPAPPPPYTGAAALDLPPAERPAPPPPMDRDTYIATRPRIRAKARVLVTDADGRVLLVRLRPAPGEIGPYWALPGGSIEADRELPRAAARREVREELGWEREPGRLLGLDWQPPGEGDRPVLVYVFDGGRAGPAEFAAIRLQEEELLEWALFEPEAAREVLSASSWQRLSACLAVRDAGGPSGPVELVRGRPV
ncbi:NUDIX hydrolase [Kitasatospora camelliae]|uniref:NUDIX hydrolase n=1 Tax=Kitasatospora camelliae TaxID=3156397 RepID=A0AAU8JS26_9ACTN